MNKITKVLIQVNHIEKLSLCDSPVHNLNPLLKLLSVLIMIIAILSCNDLDIIQLFLYLIILLIIIKIAKVPFKMVIQRSLLGLPLSLCLAISNLVLMRDLINVNGIQVTNGFLSFITIIFKTLLCLSFVFTLIATTSFNDIASSLVHIKVPSVFVLQLLMTYRYIFILVEEASLMSKAYLLKNPKKDAIEMKDMGNFIGSLLVRSFKKSQNVYDAMICKGFNPTLTYNSYEKFSVDNYFLLMMILGFMIIIKVVL